MREDLDAPPGYSQYAQQPYVTYEIHLHPTYRLPTLWFTLHDLPAGESTFDLDAVYLGKELGTKPIWIYLKLDTKFQSNLISLLIEFHD